MLSRRSLLLGGGAAVATGVAATAVGAPAWLHRAGHLVRPDPVAAHPIPAGPVGEIVSGSFFSKARNATTGWSIAYPHGTTPGTSLPFLLELHGRGDDHTVAFGSHRLQYFLSAAVRTGAAPFAIASVDGGDADYWHRRSSGVDPQDMLVSELLPLLADRGLRTDRFALGGWSMGGYGALLLAERLGSSRVAAVVADSPAIWTRYEDASQGSFDGPDDFAAHDVLGQAGALADIHIRVTCGISDPLIAGSRALLEHLPGIQHEFGPGAHDVNWWQHAAPQQLAYAGEHLAPG